MFAKLIVATAIVFSATVHAKTLRLKPGSAGKDAAVFSRRDAKDKNFGSSPRFHAENWTWNAEGLGKGTYRSLIAFDLAGLPANHTILQARLLLRCDTVNHSKGHSSLSASNASSLYRVKQAWAESTVTWDNQPPYDTAARARLAKSLSAVQDYEVDVTALVAAMAADTGANHGFLLRTDAETEYNALSFASGDHADTALHPVLEIEYEEGKVQVLSLAPGAEGKDAVVFSRSDTKARNYGGSPRFHAETWTWNADNLGVGTYRSLVEFNLKSLPSGAVVKSAVLRLAADWDNHTQGHSSLTTSNAAYLSRITEAWAESTVTWDNQPRTDTASRLLLAKSGSARQNYHLDVSEWVKRMAARPDSNFGFLLSSVQEAPYNSLSFGSSDHADSARRPRLEIRYTLEPTRLAAGSARLTPPYFRLAGRTLVFARPASGTLRNAQGRVLARFESAREVSLAGLSGILLVQSGREAACVVVP